MLSSLFSLKLDSNLTSPNFFRRQAIFHEWKNTHKSSSFSMFQKVMNLFFFFNSLFPQFTQWKLASSIRVGVYHEAGFARTQAVSLLVVLLTGDL